MENYLREYSVGGLLRNSVKIYARHFLTIILIYALPVLPFMLLQEEAQLDGNVALLLASILLNFFLGLLAFGAITIAISDICLGERPGVIRSYRKLGGVLTRLLWTNFLQVLVLLVGFLLLVVPGFILSVRLLFTSVITTQETISGRAAMKRSAALSKGYYWRNIQVLVLWTCIVIVFTVLSGVAVAGLGWLFNVEALEESFGFRTAIGGLILGVLYPVLFISIILMYYDLRVRKEAYDLRAMAEDLRR